MPRSKTILQSEYPYHITARCINREWFNLPMDSVWQIFCEELASVSDSNKLKIHSFVLMSNHFHLIASTPEANISQCMHQFMQKSSKKLTRAGNRINQTFAGRHYKCILDMYNYYLNAYKYCYRNPVNAGLCNLVEEYPFSSLKMKLGLTSPLIPLVEDTLLIEDKIGILNWLNTQPESEKLEAVRWALKRQYFQSKKTKFFNKPILDLHDTL